ncbi:hypothetical protein Q4Q35_19195 [Flavivirga aquimarina]|uniref:Beta-hexosaminidase bacterial type N-terminal domain-containing protein n=1 Tax=Flavivirga aquimarina TaxID=2027862 RepID=A0ABT8WFV4_9FLAO|nr:hypothetical protein [Flavivirga aquimarina]MDO5971933.1 hypothetical protein [Flavivirga aquimarina]
MKKIVLILSVFFILFVLTSLQEKVKISFENTKDQIQYEYVKSELTFFLNDTVLSNASNSKINHIAFKFRLKPNFEEATFSIDSKLSKGVLNVELSGKTPSDVLYAAYTLLEKGGYLFDITGPVLPKQFNWEPLKNYKDKIIPAIKKRGIRQHINFPMDISAWPLETAKEYIQNLARMRFNAITFHSYPGQWYEVVRKDTTEYAGHYFYGDEYAIPDQKDIKAIVGNKKYFCIPEIEPFYEDKAVKSKKSIEWLQKVILEAKKTGMFVQFSFEPRDTSPSVSKTVETTKAILKDYPMIDALELITEESGGWGPRTTKEQTKKTIAEHFGEASLNDSIVMKPVVDNQSDLAYIYGQVGHSIKVINYLKENKVVPKDFPLKLGIYVVISEYATPAYYLARKFAPETEVAILSEHHSLNVQNNIPNIIKNTNDWDKSMVYSWIELDGMMFIQQNAISGIRGIVDQAVKNSTDYRGNAILFNHWRTAENKISARYSAISSLYGAVDPEVFYKDYAKTNGIVSETDFAIAMKKLSEADSISIKNVSSFAFCWKGRWKRGGPLSAYPIEKSQKVRHAYEDVLLQLKSCTQETKNKNGRSILALLDNRIRTTIIYIKAFEKGRELKQFDTNNTLTEENRIKYVGICNEMLALFEQYTHLYAQINPDRGCVGNLLSLWNGPVNGVKVLRQKFGGIPYKEPIPFGTVVDEPPLPIINGDK